VILYPGKFFTKTIRLDIPFMLAQFHSRMELAEKWRKYLPEITAITFTHG
jgi:hypothetical protein